MNILGLNAWHGDAAACLLRDGKLVAAAEEERFRRIKHWAGFPAEAIRWCLAAGGLRLDDVHCVALNSDPRANLLRRAAYTLTARPDWRLVQDRLRNHARRASVEAELAAAFPGQGFCGKIVRVEHHLAHLASSFYVSPLTEAVAVSADGFGDFASTAWGLGCGTSLRLDGRVWFPHSLGLFYQALTQHLGFPHYGDEYKVMGLAPYGRPEYMAEMRRIVRLEPGGAFRLDLSFFRHHREHVACEWDGGSPHVGPLAAPALADLFGPARPADAPLTERHRDIACSAQAMYEEAFFHLLEALHARYGLDALALAGGCAMNSVANGKIRRRTPFRRLYVPAAAGDAGGAVGAALAAWQRTKAGADAPRSVVDHAAWGPSATHEEIAVLIGTHADALRRDGCEILEIPDEDLLCRRTAEGIAAGLVTGWFQGRMEWGPRALGNRSIVCDPRRADMKDLLNSKIKRRESFRPFAPSILREHAAEWFEDAGDVPFMTEVLPVRPEKRPLVPAVSHVDGTGRLQTVRRTANPRYWTLISAFQALTGVPMVLNTSFNENEPVVCRPEEALACFLRTQMDVLVLENIFIKRRRC